MAVSRFFMAFAAVAVFLASGPADAASQRRTALVIGNSNYKSSPLTNPNNDARAMSKALKALGFEVTELLNGDRNSMIRAIRGFGDRLKQGGIGLFYYAGHGVQVGGENYLIPIHAKIDQEPDVELESVRVTRVMAEMDKANNGLNIVILDACRNNPFARSFRSGVKGLAQMQAPVGTLLAYATAPGSVAADGEGNNGLYTSELLRAMYTPGAKVEDVFKKVRRGVRSKSNGRQVPWESTSIEGDFYFVPPKGGAATAPRPEPVSAAKGQNTEIVYWESIKDSKDPAAYRAYLNQYPKGTFAELAKVRMRSLETQPAPSNRQARVAEAQPEPPPQQAVGVYAPRETLEKSFKDCAFCPQMIVVPSGSFQMGSPSSERGRMPHEGPVHKVTMRSFAVGKFEVTFKEWDACVKAGGCKNKAKDNGWGRDDRPVVDVSWNDAQQYVVWLSEKTGKEYRLLSEAEWEYAARAGSTSTYPWGSNVSRNKANCNMCGSKFDRQHTAPVGSFRPNAFGLHDMIGNVWEWVDDCWNQSYDGAPVNGEPWMEGQCSSRVLRGGSWMDPARSLRSSSRMPYLVSSRLNFFGFRVARTLK